jgi:hypothetical protein
MPLFGKRDSILNNLISKEVYYKDYTTYITKNILSSDQVIKKVMQPAKSHSRKETKAICQALEALKIESERKSAKVEKRHIKYLGDFCGQNGRIHPLALSIIKNLQHYRKDSWLFEVKS